jgi:hypothetical protein
MFVRLSTFSLALVRGLFTGACSGEHAADIDGSPKPEIAGGLQAIRYWRG